MKEHSRYDRQILLREIGREGQRLLDQSCVAIAGLGAVGFIAAHLLARAGVGHLRLIDRDVTEVSPKKQSSKAVFTARKLREINPEIKIQAVAEDLNPHCAEALLGDADLILDGTDNFETRFLINDFALRHEIPWIYGFAARTEGVAYVIIPGLTPCLRCLIQRDRDPHGIQVCDDGGILPAVAHLIASFQATEAIKCLAGNKDKLDRHLWKVDVWSRHFKSLAVERFKKKFCGGCRGEDYPYLQNGNPGKTLVLRGRNAVQRYPYRDSLHGLEALGKRVLSKDKVERHEGCLSIRSGTHEIVIFENGRTLVKGTENPLEAEKIYAGCVENH